MINYINYNLGKNVVGHKLQTKIKLKARVLRNILFVVMLVY